MRVKDIREELEDVGVKLKEDQWQQLLSYKEQNGQVLLQEWLEFVTGVK